MEVQNRRPHLKFIGLRLLLAVSVGLVTITTWEGSWNPLDWFPVRYVRIQGEVQFLETDRFVQTLTPLINKSLFMVDLSRAVKVAQSLPWIEKVEAERLWPDTVVLNIQEYHPVARWGGRELLSQHGMRFTPSQVARHNELPLIEGPAGTEQLALITLLNLNNELKGTGAQVSKIRLSKRQAWSATLTNQAEIYFGRQDPVSAFRQFMVLIPKLGEGKFAEVLRLDLRYQSGFSVVWRNSPFPDPNLSLPSGA